MFLLRLFATALIAVALMILGADILATLERDGALTLHSVAYLWGLLHGPSLEAFRSVLAPLPEGFVGTMLAAPAFAVVAMLGLVFSFIARLGR